MERYRFTEEVQAAYENLQQPFAIYQFIDQRAVTIAISDGFCKLFDYNDREKAYHNMDYNMYDNLHPDDVARVANAAFRFATENAEYNVIYRVREKNGSDYRLIHSMGRNIRMENGVILGHVWYTDEGVYVEDPDGKGTELSQAISEALWEQKSLDAGAYDYMTGLPNMNYFFELAAAGRKALLNQGEQQVILFMDLSGMKFFNKEYGFEKGDALIKSLARLLSETFSNENCCHFGGDHFVVFTKEGGIEDTLNSMFGKWHKMNEGNGLPIRVGIFANRDEEMPISNACDRAKFACDSIRNSFESGFSYFDFYLQDELEKRQYILSNIDRAIEEKWINVHYQPIVRAVNGKVCDEEALARWNDPEKGLLPPSDFIPYLEDANQIYKLDLYVLEQVLEKVKTFEKAGFYKVPQSINLSRSDFKVCDIVEEIRKRVDASGVSRDLIAIEITESVIGSDFDFIKEQIERFRELGFRVWMDDFGSGYSSMDVLQSVDFDLIKFDMSFMKRLDEGDSGKIILTELMKMATLLGVDTICEGVETEEQIRFLQNIGCSKLQGFYFTKPLPLEDILIRYGKGEQIGFENPEETAYYENLGRFNLYDLTSLVNKDDDVMRNTFDALPIGVMEVDGEGRRVHYVRCNEPFREFMNMAFGVDVSDKDKESDIQGKGPVATFLKNAGRENDNDSRMFIEEKMADGRTVHSLARIIGVNPVTGKTAVAILVLSVTEADEGASYASIARALAADYYNLFYVDINNGEYIEYSSQAGEEEIAMERHGLDFFNSGRKDARERIYKDDQDTFLARFTKENILREIDEQGAFAITYRLTDTGKPVFARMKAMRMEADKDHIIVGISIIESQIKQYTKEKRLSNEKNAMRRIAALSGDYIVIYVVDSETEQFFEYSASEEYSQLGIAREGEDFFSKAAEDAHRAIAPEDVQRHQKVFTKENVIGEIREHGMFVHDYRLLINDKPVPVSLRGVLVEEDGKEKILLGVMKV